MDRTAGQAKFYSGIGQRGGLVQTRIMQGSLTKVALVIPVYNRRETTLRGLRSLSRINRQCLEIRTFVIDDGSTDGTGDAVAKGFPEVEVIKGDGTWHYAAGTNRGIEAALEWEPDYIATMNDDACFHENFLQSLVKTSRNNQRSIVGSLLLLWDEPHKVFQVGQYWDTLSGGWVMLEDLTAFNVPQEPFEVECIVGNAVLFPVEAIRECGLLDEKRFPNGWGDAQYLVRMRKAGWSLLVDPKSYVWCEPNTYPKPLHRHNVKDGLKILFVDEKHPLNLKRQFIARWDSAPSKFKAVGAFGVYLLSLAAKTLKYLIGRTATRSF